MGVEFVFILGFLVGSGVTYFVIKKVLKDDA